MPNPRNAGVEDKGEAQLTPLPCRPCESLPIPIPLRCLHPKPRCCPKGGPCSPACLRSRALRKARNPRACPEKPGGASPQWAQALLGAWPVGILRAGLHRPCAPQDHHLCRHPSALLSPPSPLRPLHSQPPQSTAVPVPTSISITTQHVVKDTGSGAPPTTRVWLSITCCDPSTPEFHNLKMGIILATSQG